MEQYAPPGASQNIYVQDAATNAAAAARSVINIALTLSNILPPIWTRLALIVSYLISAFRGKADIAPASQNVRFQQGNFRLKVRSSLYPVAYIQNLLRPQTGLARAAPLNVRWHLADIGLCAAHVCF